MLSILKSFIFIIDNIPEKLRFSTWLAPTERSNWQVLTNELSNPITRPHFMLKNKHHSLYQISKVKQSRYTPWRRLGGEKI
jgi:hypothetical protein